MTMIRSKLRQWLHWPLGSLRRQLAISIALIFGLWSVLFVWVQTDRLQRDSARLQGDQALALTSGISVATQLWLAARDDIALQELVMALQGYPDLAHVIILDARQRIVAHTNPGYRGQYLHDFEPVLEAQVRWLSPSFAEGIAPVKLGTHHLGWVRVGLNGRELVQKVEAMRERGFLNAGLSLLAAILAAMAAAWLLTTRLKRIQDVAGSVQKGNLDERVNMPGIDEAARLAGHVDRMLDALSENRRELSLAANVFTYAREAILITDGSLNIVRGNESFSRITGLDVHDFVGQPLRSVFDERQSQGVLDQMQANLAEVGHWSGELTLRSRQGELRNVLLTVSVVRNGERDVTHAVALFSDITEIKDHESALERMAHFDALTGLPNRVLFSRQLAATMERCHERQQIVSIVFLDLDGFKAINDTHGHAVGDRLLVHLAQRMKRVLRDGDMLARFGGDEFVALLQGLHDPEESFPIIERLLAVASEAVGIDGQEVAVTASLGVTVYPQADEVDSDQLLRQADQAMYFAKMAGKNCFVVFDADKERSLRSRTDHIHQLKLAIAAGELVLHYQPRVQLDSGTVVSVEALVRWQHPKHGLLLPGKFLPMIEGDPVVLELGEWVTYEALRQARQWRAQGLDIPVSINLDAFELQHGQFMARVQRTLHDFADLPAQMLEFEILETTALGDMDRVAGIVRDCAALGVRFCLDDFGTGYSSLTYLRSLPVRALKIDQSFVREMFQRGDDVKILEGIVGMAKAFSLEVVAEGVETQPQAQRLLEMGCGFAQGFGIARPMPAGEIAPWLQRWNHHTGLDTPQRMSTHA